MREERGHVSDIIRQEFADRIVATEEENRRIKNEISELRAKHRVELERAKQEVEDIKQVKDAEMEEVHKRSAGFVCCDRWSISPHIYVSQWDNEVSLKHVEWVMNETEVGFGIKSFRIRSCRA